jgi:WD40 repeat protein
MFSCRLLQWKKNWSALVLLLTVSTGCGSNSAPAPAAGTAPGAAASPRVDAKLPSAPWESPSPRRVDEAAHQPEMKAEAEIADLHDTLFPPSSLSSAEGAEPAADIPFFHLKLNATSYSSAYTNTAAFSPDGRWFAAGGSDLDGGMVKLWEVADWKDGPSLRLKQMATAIAFSSDAKMIAAGSIAIDAKPDGEIAAWDIANGTEQIRNRITSSAESVTFTPDTKLLVSGHIGHVELHSLIRRGMVRKIGEISSGVALAPDGQTIASNDFFPFSPDVAKESGYGVTLFSLTTLRKTGFLEVFHEDVEPLLARGRPFRLGNDTPCFTADGELLAASCPIDTDKGPADTVQLWNVPQRTRLAEFPLAAGLTALSITPDGKWLAAAGVREKSTASEGCLRLWNTVDRKLVYSFRELDWTPKSIAISPDGKRLATVSDKYLTVWNVPQLTGNK